MRNLIAVFILSCLCSGAGDAVAAASAVPEEAQPAAKRLITRENSTLCGLEAARHAYTYLMDSSGANETRKTLLRSSYAVNVLEYGCLALKESQWELRGSNKATNRELLQTMATVSYPALFKWEADSLILSASEPWLSFSAGYELHAPQTPAELSYVQQLKEEPDIQPAIYGYEQLKQCVIS